QRKHLEAIELARIVDDVERLSGTDFRGRRVGSAGHDRAREWLTERLATLGFDVTQRGGLASADVLEVTAAPMFALGRERLRYRRDFAEHPRSSPLMQKLTAAVVPAEGAVAGFWALAEVPSDDFTALVAELRERGAVGVLSAQA